MAEATYKIREALEGIDDQYTPFKWLIFKEDGLSSDLIACTCTKLMAERLLVGLTREFMASN